MEELSIEQKAKAYDEAIEKFGVILNLNTVKESGTIFADDVRKIFPELKESEDERIRKELIDWLKSRDGQTLPIDRYNAAISWLEKQGEHAKFRNKIQIGDKVTRNNDGVLVNLSQLKRVAKQDKQKHTDEVKPKFKIGDWITNGIDVTFQVRSIEDNMYLRSDDYFIDIETADKKFRLWTIQDAKDGDVLSYRNGQWIFIYKEKVDDSSFDYHALYSTIHQDLTINDAGFTLLSDAIIPATKEQRDLLFQKMKEAGCEWDAEKKELKKIEQKPILDVEIPFGTDSELVEKAITIPDGYYAIIEDNKVILRKGEKKSSWSEEDEENLKWFEKFFRAESVISGGKDIPQDRYLWFKNLKDRVQPKNVWSEEDEELCEHLIKGIEESEPLPTSIYSDCKRWLKHLKYRVQPQPKQKWSEEDERMLGAAYDLVTTNPRYMAKKSISRENVITWLKSLRPQSTWKPSDRQMKAIEHICDGNYNVDLDILDSIYKDFKKLREEDI